MSFFCEPKCGANVDVLVLDVELHLLVSGPVKRVRDSRVRVVDLDMVIS